MHLSVDRDRCISAGLCLMAAPEVFEHDEDGVVTLRTESPGEELREQVVQAAGNCPVQLIELRP